MELLLGLVDQPIDGIEQHLVDDVGLTLTFPKLVHALRKVFDGLSICEHGRDHDSISLFRSLVLGRQVVDERSEKLDDAPDTGDHHH